MVETQNMIMKIYKPMFQFINNLHCCITLVIRCIKNLQGPGFMLKPSKIAQFYLLSFAPIWFHSLYQSMPFVVDCCITHFHSLSLVVNRCHSLSLVFLSSSLVIIRFTTRCHSLPLYAPLVCLFINDHNDNT